MPDIRLAAGTLLVATPMLRDENFHRTVVLLCEHGEQGSFGLVLNRPTPIPAVELFDTLESVSHTVGFGGPVQPETLHFLHRLGDRLPDAVEVVDDVLWGGDFERLQALLQTNPALGRRIRFFMGYSGWGEGQLEEEVAEGAWITASARGANVFPEAAETMWRDVLLSLGGEYALIANYPADPRLN